MVSMLNPRKFPWAAPLPQGKGFPPQTSCSKENHRKKGAITWSGQGLWTYMVMVQKFLCAEASYYLGTFCVSQGVLPFLSPHKGRVGVMVHTVQIWRGAVRKKVKGCERA